MIKAIIKNNVSTETWADLSARKRHMLSLFKPSNLNADLKNEKKILIIGVADYENLGDHAIAEAQRRFLEETVGKNCTYKILEIPSRTPVRHIERIINIDDIILFTGGGNLGTKYGFLHDLYLPIIKNHPTNKKLFFPQSYTFNEEGDSEKLMNYIKSIFAKSGKNLTITARESKSFKLFKETFPENNVISTPDIVLSLNTRGENNLKREGVLMLMRDAGEKVLDFETQDNLIKALKANYSVTVHENDYPYDVSPKKRLQELNMKWNEIKKSKVVITDRLHGMIFAQISGTPCIVFDNYNNKIKMTCEDWLHDVENIEFIDPRNDFSVKDLAELTGDLMSKSVKEFDVNKKYAPLAEKLKSFVK